MADVSVSSEENNPMVIGVDQMDEEEKQTTSPNKQDEVGKLDLAYDSIQEKRQTLQVQG